MRLRIRIWLPAGMLLLLLACTPDDQPARRGLDREQLNEYRQDARFDYDRQIVPWENPLYRVLGVILGFFGFLFNHILGWVALGGLLIALVVILLRMSKRARQQQAEVREGLRLVKETEVEEADFERLIVLALQQQDYRLAIRYTFLNALKILSMHKHISIREGKTNREYYLEAPAAVKPVFRQLITVFEYVWYGRFPTDEPTYQAVAAAGRQLQELVRKPRANA